MTTIAQMTDSEAVTNLLRKVPLFANEDEVCIEETEEWRLCEGELFVKWALDARYEISRPSANDQRGIKRGMSFVGMGDTKIKSFSLAWATMSRMVSIACTVFW